MYFHDRTDAGRRLAKALLKYQGQDVVVLALPRGGVPVAAEVARALGAPLDLVLVRKIGAPFDEELAIGAVAEGAPPIMARNEAVIAACRIGEQEFQQRLERQLAEMARRRRIYLSGRPAIDLSGRIAILVDDGVATGATTRAALRATRQRRPGKLVLAVPVGEADVMAALAEEADEVVCLQDHLVGGGVGPCYDVFGQVSDAEVNELLERLAPPDGAP
ncbi:phosphoribosyltransferase [Phenylobacterium montanum]|uniref:Phosphoribosyltransferase n=1 Tax=Phenylobacterium montanum TaxID=2823693 RepID=A0A975ITW4_9CAUL|nr:phosphoribosyltransferase family protein [Caulobacter sp. S6]QUD86894.1 phosphoribosyltransferase [Caulobacter sp. S6]